MKRKISNSHLKDIALTMAVNCVRNTVIEDYHADGKLDDIEMMALNKEVANKIYTFLRKGLFGENAKETELFLKTQAMMFPHNWDEPSLDEDFMNALGLAKDMGPIFDKVTRNLGL